MSCSAFLPAAWRFGARVFLILALAAVAIGPARADSVPLLLDVTVNGTGKNLVGNFVRDESGEIGAAVRELEEVGIKAPAGAGREDVVLLHAIGVAYEYDEARQTIAITAPFETLATQKFDLLATPEGFSEDPALKPQRNLGALLNYTLFASGTHDLPRGQATYNGVSATLDSRFFSGFGTVSQTGIVGDRLTGERGGALRLDTGWVFSDPDTAITYKAGDEISGGLVWTRPIRLGGVQVQRNFALRGDLVTLPLPTLSGSAAVPSSVEVYVNNARTFVKDVAAGPFQISNLPVVSGAGQARLVLRDASGRQIESSTPFFVATQLLKPGLVDFSVEAGFARLDYGRLSFSYDKKPVASGSLRYGLTDWMTLQSHVEGAPGFILAGIGADARVGGFGLFTLAGSATHGAGGTGFQAYAGLDFQWGMLTFNAATQRTFGNYLDLAAITAPVRVSSTLASVLQATGTGFDFGSARPNKSLDRISVGIPLVFDSASLSVSLAQMVDANDRRSRIASVSLSRSLFESGTIFANAFVDLQDRSRTGVFVGYSRPIGKSISANTSAGHDKNGWSLATQAVQAMGTEVGAYGWRVSDQEGATKQRSAALAYRTRANEIEAGVTQAGTGVVGTMQVAGSLAIAASDVFVAPRVPDAFAVVDVGAPGVAVAFDNHPIGKTGASGKMLVPGLRSFQKNRLAIDPDSLPVDAQIESTKEDVMPADGGAVVVSFGVKEHVPAALVRLVGADGQPLAAGYGGTLNETTDFIVGYDGRAYISGLSAANRVVVHQEKGSCEARFDYQPDGDRQIQIGPVSCS
jgi:outer membrane usher protein